MASRKELEALVQEESIKKLMLQQAARQMKSEADAEDVIQETVRILLDRSDEDMKRIYNPGGFYWIIFERTLLRTKENSEKRKTPPLDEDISANIYEPLFTKTELERFISREKESKRKILFLHFEDGCNSVDIADKVKKSDAYIRKVIGKFMKKLVEINGKK